MIQQFTDAIKDMIANSSKKSVRCPCCQHDHKIYKKSISSRLAQTMIDMYNDNQQGWVHVPQTRTTECQNYADLKFWGFIIMATPNDKHSIGGRTTGYWRLTDAGVDFMQGNSTAAKYAHIYNNQNYGFSGSYVTFKSCLSTSFNFHAFIALHGW